MAKALEKAYDSFNRKFFENSLPKIPVRWSSTIGIVGRAKDATMYAAYLEPSENEPDGSIIIAEEFKPYWEVWRTSLLHEMAHVKLREHPSEITGPASRHTKVWKKEMRRLAAAGAFDALW